MNLLCYTLGCKLNQMESDSIMDGFRQFGWGVIHPNNAAHTALDLIILNTCTVTGKAEQKARRMIRKYLREFPQAVVVVTGCFAQLEGDALREIDSRVVVVGQEEKPKLLELPEKVSQGASLLDGLGVEKSADLDSFSFTLTETERGRPFIKIQDGCNNRCGYCRVPLARGNSVSLGTTSIIDQVKRVVDQGFQEYVLTGVNLTLYKDGNLGLTELLEKLIVQVPHARIRLSSIEPNFLTSNFLDVIQDTHICPHFHIPIQSGSSKVLALASRRYNRDDVYRGIGELHTLRPNSFIGADIITGLPGEDEQAFLDTKTLLQDLSVTQTHVFPFSPRKGTKFYGEQRCTERERDIRAQELRRLSEKQLAEYKNRMKGKKLSSVLVSFHENRWEGLTENYLSTTIDHKVGFSRGIIIESVY